MQNNLRKQFPAMTATGKSPRRRQLSEFTTTRAAATTRQRRFSRRLPDGGVAPYSSQSQRPSISDATETAASYNSDSRTAAVPNRVLAIPGSFQTAPGPMAPAHSSRPAQSAPRLIQTISSRLRPVT